MNTACRSRCRTGDRHSLSSGGLPVSVSDESPNPEVLETVDTTGSGPVTPFTENADRPSYDASDITLLEGLDAVRKRPGMYIGSTGERGLHQLVWEIVDNAVDEAMAGYADRVVVVLQADGGVRVEDNGRGIPVGLHPIEKIPAVTLVLTVLH